MNATERWWLLFGIVGLHVSWLFQHPEEVDGLYVQS
jgi:hypothetical protein